MSRYTIAIKTSSEGSQGTDSEIYLTMTGETGKVDGEIHLNPLISGDAFWSGQTDKFVIERTGLGRIVKIQIRSDGSGPGSDWTLNKVEIVNLDDNYQSNFMFQTTITGDEGPTGVQRTAQGYPWPVRITEFDEPKVNFVRQVAVEVNDTGSERSFTLHAKLEGAQQMEISKEQYSGTQISASLTYQSPASKFGGLEASAKASWETAVNGKRVQKGSEGYAFEEEKKFTLKPHTIYAYDKIWSFPVFEGKVTVDNRQYAIKGIKNSPSLSVNTFEVSIGGDKKLPYRFKKYMLDSGQTDLANRLAAMFEPQTNLAFKTTLPGGIPTLPQDPAMALKPLFQSPPALLMDGRSTFAVADPLCQFIQKPAFGFGCWTNPGESTSDDQTLVAFNTARGENCNMIGFDAQRKQFFYFDPNTGYVYSNGDYRFGAWYHVYAEVHDSSVTLYVNGDAVVSAETNTWPDPSGRFSIGQEWDGQQTSDFFDGMIAEVRVWNKGLGAEQIRKTYKTPLTGKEEGLLAYYPMDEESGEVLFDLSANELHATIIGPAEWESDTKLPLV